MKIRTTKRILSAVLTFSILLPTLCGCGASRADTEYLEKIGKLIGKGKSVETSAAEIIHTVGKATQDFDGTNDHEKFYADMDAFLATLNEQEPLLKEQLDRAIELRDKLKSLDVPTEKYSKAAYEGAEDYCDQLVDAIRGSYDIVSVRLAISEAEKPMDDMARAGLLNGEFQSNTDMFYTAYDVYLADSEIEVPPLMEDSYASYVNEVYLFVNAVATGANADSFSDFWRIMSALELNSREDNLLEVYKDQLREFMVRVHKRAYSNLTGSIPKIRKEVTALCKQETKDTGFKYKEKMDDIEIECDFVDEIFPNTYDSLDCAADVLVTTGGAKKNILVRAKIDGFSQTYEKKAAIDGNLTRIIVKPAVISDISGLESGHDTKIKIEITDTDSGETLYSESHGVNVHSIYDYQYVENDHQHGRYLDLLNWLSPDADAVAQIRRTACDKIGTISGQSNVQLIGGYQYTLEGTEADITFYQVAAMHAAVASMGVTLKEQPIDMNAMQTIRTPDAILKEGTATPLEMAMLMASAVTSSGMHPMILIIQDRVSLLVEMWDNYGDYIMIDPSMLPVSGTFSDLERPGYCMVGQGAMSWKQYISQYDYSDVHVIDCAFTSELGKAGINYQNKD